MVNGGDNVCIIDALRADQKTERASKQPREGQECGLIGQSNSPCPNQVEQDGSRLSRLLRTMHNTKCVDGFKMFSQLTVSH